MASLWDSLFGESDQAFRDRLERGFSPETRAYVQDTQNKLWRNQFLQQMPQSLQNNASLTGELFNMPELTGEMPYGVPSRGPSLAPMPSASIPETGPFLSQNWGFDFSPGRYQPQTNFNQRQLPVRFLK